MFLRFLDPPASSETQPKSGGDRKSFGFRGISENSWRSLYLRTSRKSRKPAVRNPRSSCTLRFPTKSDFRNVIANPRANKVLTLSKILFPHSVHKARWAPKAPTPLRGGGRRPLPHCVETRSSKMTKTKTTRWLWDLL